MPDNIKSKKDPIKTAIDNNPCGSCRAMGLPSCKGHGASGGGDSESDEAKKKETTYSSNQIVNTRVQASLTSTTELDKAKAMWVQSQLLSNDTNKYEVGLLSIVSDRLRGNLTITIKSGLSKVEEEIARKYLETIKTEFSEFKDQLADKGKNFTATLVGNQLSIHIPNPKYYGQFIEYLSRKNLLPIPDPEREENKEALRSNKEGKQSVFNPTPFSTRLEK